MDRELRRDPLTGRWVALCAERVQPVPLPVAEPSPCPFCAPLAAPQLATHGDARAVPHRVPALRVEAADRAIAADRFEGLGCHEVIVESSRHGRLATQAVEVSVHALLLARDRHRDLWRDRRLRWLGWQREAREHPVATVAGAAQVPERVMEEEVVGADLALVSSQAFADGRRWVAHVGGAVAFCPLAPETAFEVLVVPPRPHPHLAASSDEDIAATARLLWQLQQVVSLATDGVGQRVRLHQAPGGGRVAWYLRLQASLTVGGSDLAGVLPSHPGFPEEVAMRLRGLWHDAGRAGAWGEVPA